MGACLESGGDTSCVDLEAASTCVDGSEEEPICIDPVATVCGAGGTPGCTVSTPPAQANCRKPTGPCDPLGGGC